MPYTTLVAGTTILASWANANVRDQGVTPFASASARTSAVTSPLEGMLTALTDVDTVDVYTGAAWLSIAAYGAMTDYSASLTLTASTTNPTKGNSTYAAKYTQIGKMVYFSARVAVGSTFSAGSGSYRLSLPVTAAASATTQDLGSVLVVDSGTAVLVGSCILQSTTTVEMYIANITGGALSSTGPGTAWANGDVIQVSIRYEAA